MFKRFSIFLYWVMIAGLCLLSGAVHAQNSGTITLTQNDLKGKNIGQSIYVLQDSLGDFTAQDIVSRFQNNVRGQKNTKDIVTFPFKPEPYWMAFEVKNNTNEKDWVLDFGSLTEGRSGLIARLLVYEGRKREIIFDGLSRHARSDQKNTVHSGIPLTLQKGNKTIIILYLYPTDHKPLHFKPSLISLKNTVFSHQSDKFNNFFEKAVPIISLLSAAILICGLLLNQSLGLLPLVAYYIGIFGWFTFVESPVFSYISGFQSLPALVMISNTVLILSSTLLITKKRPDDSVFRILMFFAIGLCILTLFFVTVVLSPGNILRPFLIYIASFISLFISIGFLSVHLKSYNRTMIMALTAWIILYISAQAISLIYFLDIISNPPLLAHSVYLILPLQLALLLIGITGSIDSDYRRRITEVIRKAQKSQTLLKAKQTKESADQSRLLRVIEREREIMEELREREAERTEEMRQAKIAADEANNAKSAFLAVVSHEIRTPMTGVMGMIRLLEETGLESNQKDYVMTIRDSGDAMLALLNDILDFSKIEGDAMDIESIAFEPHRVLNGVIMLMKGHAEQKNIDLLLNIDPNVPKILMGDPTRMRQVFLNLVGNALKFTEKGHVQLSVKCDPDHISHNPEEQKYALYFSVEDTGIGISVEAQENLFKPFTQADNSISRKYGGTGLGLAICRRLIQAMGGQIELFSREGKGTTFYFTLVMNEPADDENNASHETATTNHTQQNETRINPMHFLIVDDNAINRKVVAGLLGRDHHTFDSAEKAEDAFKKLREGTHYDAIFMDIMLPDMPGTDAAIIIHEDLDRAHVPIIALTGNVAENDIANYRAANMDYHIAKPINPDYLRQVIGMIQDKKNGKLKPEHPDQETQNNNDDDVLPILNFEETSPTPQTSLEENDAPSAITKPVDEAMLKGLKDGLGGAQVKELLEGLFEKSYEVIADIQHAYEQKDSEQLMMRAHELKGMCGNFGLIGISQHAAFIERHMREDNPNFDSVTNNVETLADLLERSKIITNDLLG